MIHFRGALSLLLAAALYFALSAVSMATETDPQRQEIPALPVLPPVTVIGVLQNPATGQATMERKIMEQLPAGNGSINDLLGLFPDVQLAEDSRTTSNASEILPPRFSISGGKTYQNNFLIDGVHNESLLDPAATDSVINDIPGHPQALFLDAGLVEKISVFDSNIPARYGGFTGGVIVVETRDPGANFGGKLFYRTTRADWTRFHLDEEEAAPNDFTKHAAGFDLQVPLSSGIGLLGSYRQLYSRIPLSHLGEPAVQSRRKEDFFLKYAQQLSDANLRLTFAATPYTSESFIPNAKNSDFILQGGGSQLQLEYERSLSFGEWQTQAFYQLSRNSREAPADFLAWANTDRHAWGRVANVAYSLEGGFGDLEKEQESVSLRTSLAMEPVYSGKLAHTAEIGLELKTIGGTFERKDTTRVYVGAKIEPGIICGADDYACSDGEQYFTSRIVYPQAAVSAQMNRGAFYLQDELRLSCFSLRPGVRLSYDDFMENLDIAPRLAASCDLFGNEQTLLIAGINRYYGQTLLTYKLREAQQPEIYEYRSTYQGLLTEWQPQADRGHNVSRYSRLDTPYSDEFTAGVDQALLGGRLSLKYVRRDNKDEFARDYGPLQADGLRVYTLTNRGESRHESVRLTWERSWARHFFSVNGTWQETAASNEDYDDILNTEDLAERVWYEDHIVYKSELPRADFNRSWTANLVYTGKLFYGFSFTNVTRYRSGYPSIVDTGASRQVPSGEGRRDPVTGEAIPESLPVLEEKDLADGLVFDWVLQWQSPGKRHLQLRLEVDNVFDARLETGAKKEYEIGRQFWAGAELNF
jgi:hypothetical protein